MNLVIAITLIILFGLLTLSSYVDRVYAEIGKFFPANFKTISTPLNSKSSPG